MFHSRSLYRGKVSLIDELISDAMQIVSENQALRLHFAVSGVCFGAPDCIADDGPFPTFQGSGLSLWRVLAASDGKCYTLEASDGLCETIPRILHDVGTRADC